MIKHPRYLNASNPTRPYEYDFNAKGLYASGYASNTINPDELTDDEIDAFIKSDADYLGTRGSDFDVKSDLYGDAYADAILADM